MPGTPTCVYPRDRGKGDAKTVHCMGGKIGIPMVSKIFQMGNPSKYFNGYINPYYWVDYHPLLIYVWKWWELISKDLGKFHRDHFWPSSHPKWCVTKGIPPNALSSYSKQTKGDTMKVCCTKLAFSLFGSAHWFFASLDIMRDWEEKQYIYILYIYNLNREGTWFVYPADHGMLQRSLFFCFRIMSEAKHPWRLYLNPSKHHLFLSVRYLRYQEHGTIMYLQHLRISHMFWKTYEV